MRGSQPHTVLSGTDSVPVGVVFRVQSLFEPTNGTVGVVEAAARGLRSRVGVGCDFMALESRGCLCSGSGALPRSVSVRHLPV